MHPELARLERRYLEIESLLARPEIAAQANEFRKLSIERSELETPVALFRDFKRIDKDIADTTALYNESSGEMKDLAYEELTALKEQRAKLEEELRVYLLPKDKNDSRNVLVEIRAAAGGDESSLFAAELWRAYTRFCERRKWKTEVLSLSDNGLGGVKEVVMFVEGQSVYKTLKYESGVHRVQRVPETEAQGRVHTSTVTVAILPEADEVDEININEGDLRIDTFRAGGAGGQHVNRTDSAVRITHLPTNIVIVCQDERSQLKNKSKAMKILQSKLLDLAQEAHEKSISDERRLLVGRGDRSERIRTYNFPQSRVTDHRINFTTHAIHDFMDGDMSEMVDLLEKHAQAEALKKQAEAANA